MFGFLTKDEPVLDQESITWLFESFGWALQHLDSDIFFTDTILVTPRNEHFPGTANSIPGIAELIFNQVAAYAGMHHWPCLLINQNDWVANDSPKVIIEGALRGPDGIPPADIAPEHRLAVTYDAQQINNPEALIATFAHTLAHYLASMAPESPPGGDENWAQTTEVVAVFLGFGLMLSNSAYAFRTSGCGSCRSAASGRNNFLSQYDTTYALAIFAHLKELPVKAVTAHLKKPLRGFYKQCAKDVANRTAELAQLRSALSAVS